MADKKISQLPAATTPLAGTEVLPIVQSGTTVKVSVDNLTAGKPVSCSNLTYTGTLTGSTGILNIGSGQLYKDASGNLGIGGAPSAYDTTFKALQVNRAGFSGAVDQSNVSTNVYYNAGWKYIGNDYATLYSQYSGKHVWLTAPAGTAGNAISFAQAMTLDASGNLGIGTNSVTPNIRLQINSTSSASDALMYTASANGAYKMGLVFEASGLNAGFFGYNNSGSAYLGVPTGTAGISTTSAIPIVFSPYGSECMRITTGGEVYIAGTTDQGAYNLQCNGTGVWGAGAYVNGSDAALKENVNTLGNSLGLINAMRPVTFTYKEDYSKDRSVQTGFIAQELQEVLAGKDYLDGIVQAGPEHLNVAYQNLIPLLVKAVQELTARVAQLEAQPK